MDDTNDLPPTLLFVHTSTSVYKSVRAIWNNLKAMSQLQPRKWTVNITQRVPRASNRGDHKKPQDSSSILFMRFSDCGTCMLSVNDTQIYQHSDVIIADENIEDIMTQACDLTVRSVWKAQGQSYRLGDFIVSAGVLERGSLANTAVIELSYVGGNNCTTTTVNRMYALVESIVDFNCDELQAYSGSCDKLAGGAAPPKSCSDSDVDPYVSQSQRCLLWVDMLQL